MGGSKINFPRVQPLAPLSSDNPLVSVVMFCRNRAYCVRRAVESLLNQNYGHWELVIQDGASTDGTRETIESYQDPRIKMISESDNGPFDAMWRALKRCQGEIIGFCLSDEELLPQALGEGVNYFLCHPEAGALGRDLYYTDLEGTSRIRVDASEFNFHDYLGQQSKMSLVTVLFRKAALTEVGLMTRAWRTDCADFELIARIGEKFRFDYYPGPSALFAQGHAGQLSTTPEVGFFCTQGHLRFIDEFYRESPTHDQLRDLALTNAFSPVKQLYQAKGATALEAKLDAYFAEFSVQPVVPSLELARQAAQIGVLDLALSFLQTFRPAPDLYAEWLNLLLRIFDQFWQQEEALEKWRELVRLNYPHAHEQFLFNWLRVGHPTVAQSLEHQREWAARFSGGEDDLPVLHTTMSDRVKVAFHSSDWSTLESTHQVRPWLTFLADLDLEVTAYGPTRPNPTEWPTNVPFISTDGLESKTFVRQVREARVDILIELSGLNRGHQWSALKLRCAPIQVAYLGHMATTGLDHVDFQLSDSFISPEGSEVHHSEKLLRFPNLYTCFAFPSQPERGVPQPRRFDLRPTFASFAPSPLFSHTLLSAWATLLQRVPESRLLISNVELNSGDARSFLRSFFDAQGITSDRLTFVSRPENQISPWLSAQVDLYLDTFPHSDPVGVACALSRGTPAVTLTGETMGSRLGGSVLNSIGKLAWVASNVDQYLSIAADLVNQEENRAEWKEQLPRLGHERGLTDPASFAHKFRSMLRKICHYPPTSSGADRDS